MPFSFRSLLNLTTKSPPAPDEPDAVTHYKRANSLRDLGQWDAALTEYDRAIGIDPGFANAYCNRGAMFERLGRREDALASYDRTVALNPGDALAYYNRGAVLAGLGQPQAALDSYDRAIAIRPDYAEAHFNRGVLLQGLNRWNEALAGIQQAIALNPACSTDYAWYSIGAAQAGLQQWESALASLDRALALRGANAEAHCLRGNMLRELQRPAQAVASYDRAIGLRADYVDALLGRAYARHELNRFEEAIADYDRVIELQADCVGALRGRGFALHTLKRYEEAVASYDRAISLKADFKDLPGMRRYAKMHICDWSGLDADVAWLSEGLRRRAPVSPPFQLLALLDSAPLQLAAAQIWVSEICPPSDVLGPTPSRAPSDKIRIGYFSADFRLHPVTLLMAEMFETHDRSRFETTAFAFGPPADDAISARLARGFDRFLDVRDRSDTEIAVLARELGIDIAVDLGGFTEYSRTRIFAMRAAPLQVSYIGYLGTMGAPYIDYLIADDTIIPAANRGDYSEKIIYLPSYQANHAKRRIAERSFSRAELGLPPAGFVFTCCNANYKISPATFAGWMRILGRVEGSVLFLNADNAVAERNLRREAAHCGIEPNRIVFAARLPIPEYLARYRAMDLFLDTLPYNAGATASDALWAGLPVLTRPGTTFAGRVAASLLNAIEMPELIATGQQDYEDLAVHLAGNPAHLEALRQKLAHKRTTAPLFDVQLFTKHLESAYAQIHARYLARLPPDHIHA
ncbi:MAG: tetratricopeptide repeat protein [Steroidobacterales bacterium]